MFKRLFFVGIFTGLSQLIVLGAFRVMGDRLDASTLSLLGQLDAVFFLIVYVIGFGLQSEAMRSIAITADWKPVFYKTQSARMAMGFCLLPFALLAFGNAPYGLLLAAPLLAFNADYALYALGKPVYGAFIAFLRNALPYAILLTGVLLGVPNIIWLFLAGLLVIWLGTNFLIQKAIEAPVIQAPSWNGLKGYLDHLSLGLVQIGMYVLGSGLLLIVPYFYPASVVALVVVAFKVYMIYKGVLRVLHQSFMNRMAEIQICLLIDRLSILVGCLFLGSLLFFPASFGKLFTGQPIAGERFVFWTLLGTGAVVYAFALSATTQGLLEKKDRMLMIGTVSSALVCIVFAVAGKWLLGGVTAIGLSILAGELVFTVFMVWIGYQSGYLKQRMGILLQCVLFAAVASIIRYVLHDTVIGMIGFLGLFGGLFLAANYKRLKLGM